MQFKKILVPVDFSHFSKKALDEAVKLAECCKGKVYLLHVEEDIFNLKKVHKNNQEMEPIIREAHQLFMKEYKAALEKFKKYIPAKLLAKVVIKEGHPFVEIINFAKKQAMDLIVLSRHGKSAIKHALLGSNVEKVVRKATCAVMVVKDKKI